MPSRRDCTSPESCKRPRWVEMRDWPMRVISCSSLTESSSFSSNATMRNRVASDSARRNLRVELMLGLGIFRFFVQRDDAREDVVYKFPISPASPLLTVSAPPALDHF